MSVQQKRNSDAINSVENNEPPSKKRRLNTELCDRIFAMENFKQAQRLKNKIDDIRNCLGTGSLSKEIHIPSIVVLGDQSSGKSSLLELLSGIDIPRAEGICTRVPLEMRLRSIRADQDEKMDEIEYAMISAMINNQRVEQKISLKQTSKKIQEFTEAIAGENKSISASPIVLTIYRADHDCFPLLLCKKEFDGYLMIVFIFHCGKLNLPSQSSATEW